MGFVLTPGQLQSSRGFMATRIIATALDDNLTNLRRKCVLCKKPQVMIVKTNDYNDWINKRKPAQAAFPNLTDPEREVLLSGICGKCWIKEFGDSYDE